MPMSPATGRFYRGSPPSGEIPQIHASSRPSGSAISPPRPVRGFTTQNQVPILILILIVIVIVILIVQISHEPNYEAYP